MAKVKRKCGRKKIVADVISKKNWSGGGKNEQNLFNLSGSVSTAANNQEQIYAP
jgi:hypothetical protein